MKKTDVKNTANGIVKRIKSFYLEHKIAAAFVTLSGAMLLYYILFILARGSDAVLHSFMLKGDDFLMDYYNSVRDVAQGTGVYTDRHVIYPPMANLIMLIFSRFMPAAYLNTDFVDRLYWVQYPSAICSLLFYLGIPALLLLLLCYRQYQKGNKTRCALAAAVLFAYPVLYAMERGNIILWSVLATLYYVFHYDSESRVHRELSLLALAFAFSLKLYPALLGLLLVADKRYKDAIRAAIYGILLLVLPCFFFGGPQCFLWIYENTRMFSSAKNAYWTKEFFPYADALARKLLDLVPFLLIGIAFLIGVFVQKERYKVFLMGVAVMHAYPAFSALYTWGFFLAPFFLLLKKERPTRLDWVYAILLGLPLILTPWGEAKLRRGMVSICLLLLIALSVIETGILLYRALRARKAAKA